MTEPKSPVKESAKTTGRVAVLAAVGVIVTWAIRQFLPVVPVEVTAAIITLMAIGYDNFAYHKDLKFKMPF